VASDRKLIVDLPVVQVTGTRAVIHTDRGPLKLETPSARLGFEEMQLVDESLTRILHTWTVPEEGVPRGVSEDGRELYVDYCEDLGLALGIGEQGFRLLPISPEISSEVEWIKDGPKDPKNSFLSFVKIKQGAKTFYVRFSAPCT
jgi:hypothetical protein